MPRREDLGAGMNKQRDKLRFVEKKGLPPGPICNPGMQAIMAALYPNDTEYLYFCHDSDGTPYYSTNYESHQYNLQLAGLS